MHRGRDQQAHSRIATPIRTELKAGKSAMQTEPTSKELGLAERANELEDAASRPKIAGGGLLADAINFVTAHVPPKLITAALVVFLAYHAWDYFNRAQQMVAQLEAKRAEAAQVQADADAQNAKIKDESLKLATVRAELAKTQADAATAKAEAAAQGARRSGDTVRLATLTAELAKTQADAAKAQAEADAQTQLIGGMQLSVLQKQAEVETAEAEARAKIQNLRNIVNQFVTGSMSGRPTPIDQVFRDMLNR
jgi:hypothetical protein